MGNIGGGGSPFFKENGNYQATHTINMAFKKLLNLSTPSEPHETATKDYVAKVGNDVSKDVDDKNANIKKEVDEFIKLLDNVSAVNKIYVDQKPNIIAVNARFSGNLRENKYQFAFAGSAADHDDDRLRFVVPHRGFIKKVNVKLTPFNLRFMFQTNALFAITINGIEVITCFIENYPNDSGAFENVGDVKVTTNPFLVNKPVEEGSVINIKTLSFDYLEDRTPTYLSTILLELDPL